MCQISFSAVIFGASVLRLAAPSSSTETCADWRTLPDDARLAHPKTRLEAITSRPMLLCGVARLTRHVGQCRLLLTLSHAAGDQIKSMIANIRKGLDHVLASAPQLPKPERWRALVRYIVGKIIAARPKFPLPLGLPPPSLAFGMG